jgi:hypothetical protein
MPTTTNFGWTTPADTDLVKDGAAAIRTLAGNIDTSLVDLKGGTTGQVLSKNSNTDLDYAWVAQDDSNAIQNAIVDAKGDLISATANDTPARLASSGVNNDVLTVDTSTATGLKWAAPAAGSNWSSLGSSALSGSSTVTISGISGKNKLLVLVQGASCGTASQSITLRFNSDSGSNYNVYGFQLSSPSTYSTNSLGGIGQAQTNIPLGDMSSNAASTISSHLILDGCNTSGVKIFSMAGSGTPSGGNSHVGNALGGFYNSASTISSVSVIAPLNFDAGNIYVYSSNN